MQKDSFEVSIVVPEWGRPQILGSPDTSQFSWILGHPD